MNPSESFWDGVGRGIGESPWWALLGAVLVIGVLFLVARYIYPGHKELKMRELCIREREAENDAERIKANSALAENMRGLRESNDRLAEQSAALVAGIEESKTRSREMGSTVGDTNRTAHSIDDTTKDSNRKITEIHVQMHDLYGILNNREEKL